MNYCNKLYLLKKLFRDQEISARTITYFLQIEQLFAL